MLNDLPQQTPKTTISPYMSILQSLLILSALASLLVTGPNLVPVQSYAAAVGDSGGYKTTKDYKDSIKKDVYAEFIKPISIWARTTSATGVTVTSRQTKVSRQRARTMRLQASMTRAKTFNSSSNSSPLYLQHRTRNTGKRNITDADTDTANPSYSTIRTNRSYFSTNFCTFWSHCNTNTNTNTKASAR